MALYFVSYDLRKPGRNYDELYGFLARLGAKQILESTYCFKSSDTVVNLRDRFREYIDINDGIIVSQVTSWASYKTKATPKDL